MFNNLPQVETVDAGRREHPDQPCGMAEFDEENCEVDDCDGYVVLVIDRQLDEVDSYGPFREGDAENERLRRAQAVVDDGLEDVDVQLARFHWPPPVVGA